MRYSPIPPARAKSDEHLATAATMYRKMGMTFWLEKAEAHKEVR